MFKEYTVFKFSRSSSKKYSVYLVWQWRCEKLTPLSLMFFKELNFIRTKNTDRELVLFCLKI